MLVALVTGAGAGLGTLLVARGVLAPSAPLDRTLRALDGTRRRPGGLAISVVEGLGVDLGRQRTDLAVCGRALDRHAFEKLACAGALAALPIGCAAVARMGGINVAGTLVAVASAAAALVGFVVPDLIVKADAERKRREFRHALGAYLDLVAIVVAGGGGTETALYAAVEVGGGWPFAELRRTLAGCRIAAEPPWAALDRLGERLGVDELREVAASVGLAGEYGAKVRHSLSVRAKSMRDHRIAEVESDAQAATEKMSIPVVLMLFGFVAFVLYPALQLVLQGV